MPQQISPEHAVLPRRVFFLRATEAIEMGRYMDVIKPDILQQRYQLCLRQSASDSIGPQPYITSRFRAEWGVEHYIGKLQSPSWA